MAELPGPSLRETVAVRMTDAGRAPTACSLVAEVAIELRVHELPYVTLMATPSDLADLAVGFALTDAIAHPSEIVAVEPAEASVALRLAPVAFARFLQRRQARVTRSFTSCGVCGVETAADLPKIPRVAPGAIRRAAILRALAALPSCQALNRATRAAHAAAWVAPSGEIMLVREDVGRHNALDKLIGARAAMGAGDAGFCLVTSRCSFEMVQKAAAAGFGLLVAVSAPTSLAVAEAQAAGMVLVALARQDSQLVYTGAEYLAEDPPG